MQVERPLVLEISRHEVTVGRPIAVRVRDRGGHPIDEALVEGGSKRTRTDERGRCELTFHSPGFWKIIATKSPTERVAYEPDATLVRVLPRSSTVRTARRLEP
ncbi:carboxypeptidase regulatory-like domain-containing protein [Natronorubrum aibiense]|uniref:Carboxypeptidase regulatory-like domain-containing protein n=1 Tax=Natronorubrum aibiense TaxID=348826 RepID=A0A5P9P6G7_9EURY|nr:carboxypeptidase regulatory-like domain-containing protein [Natronorubrum aibiense]QFU83733.1 carboxypeptidase regulatory-like domain-containing protein [Natronorubrum aibiense]